MSGRRDSRGSVDVGPHVALVGHDRRACVQADAEMDLAWRERIGHRPCSGYCTGCRREGEEERVSLRVYLDSALGGARLTHDAAVCGERIRVDLSAQLVQELRRALDVRKEEGDGACREVVAHAA